MRSAGAGVAFLYPGQGSQHEGMLSSLPKSAAITRTLDEAAAHLNGLDGLDTASSLASTTNTQLALLICGVAAARALSQDHHINPDHVAGHSVGAFAAAVTADILTLPEALAAVRLRGELMIEACAHSQWGMSALAGLPRRMVQELVSRIGTDEEPLWVANINTSNQIVLSGTTLALMRAEDAVRLAGARDFERLDVNIASHCPLQAETARQLRIHLSGLPRRKQTAAYLSNTGGRQIRNDADGVIDDLANSVACPVQWYNITRLLPDLGVTDAVQMPPGHVLTHLLGLASPQLRTYTVDGVGLEAISARLRAHGAPRI